MSSTAGYRILRRRVAKPGDPQYDPNQPNQPILSIENPNTQEYTYVASALSIAIAFINSPHAKQAMLNLARTFDAHLPTAEKVYSGRPLEDLRAQITQFGQILQTATPVILLDGTIDAEVSGFHPRGEWSGNFNPAAQAIYVNLRLVQEMVNNSSSVPVFQRFQFQFVNLFFHEIGAHLFITYLYHGRPRTPKEVMPQNWIGQPQPGDDADSLGESGRMLETFAFGGTLEFYNNPISTPYIVGDSGAAKRVTASAIQKVVIQRNFDLPYATSSASQDVRSLAMGQGGRHIVQPAGASLRPLIARATQMPFEYRISEANLRLVPSDPSILAQVA
ncbi:hypothetical protein FQN55_000642 [Onygenales sp. PD_40]|nr:hypothetical protein FQN55_000642 [Onygenales sp. PD_40]KAK2785371.1 hypothetical protein FQN51_003813 [Onygenales sp. PD_10]